MVAVAARRTFAGAARALVLQGLVVSGLLALLAAPATAAEIEVSVEAGGAIDLPAGDAEVLVDDCGDGEEHVGPSYSEVEVHPEGALDLGSVPGVEAIRSGGAALPIVVPDDARPGSTIIISWTTVAEGCYSARGSWKITVEEPSGGEGGIIAGGAAPIEDADDAACEELLEAIEAGRTDVDPSDVEGCTPEELDALAAALPEDSPLRQAREKGVPWWQIFLAVGLAAIAFAWIALQPDWKDPTTYTPLGRLAGRVRKLDKAADTAGKVRVNPAGKPIPKGAESGHMNIGGSGTPRPQVDGPTPKTQVDHDSLENQLDRAEDAAEDAAQQKGWEQLSQEEAKARREMWEAEQELKKKRGRK